MITSPPRGPSWYRADVTRPTVPLLAGAERPPGKRRQVHAWRERGRGKEKEREKESEGAEREEESEGVKEKERECWRKEKKKRRFEEEEDPLAFSSFD